MQLNPRLSVNLLVKLTKRRTLLGGAMGGLYVALLVAVYSPPLPFGGHGQHLFLGSSILGLG